MPDLSVDFIGRNGVRGEVASLLTNGRLDAATMRPWIGTDGKAYITVCKGDPKKKESYKPVLVANATLRKEEWMALDEAIAPVARENLVGIQDLLSAGLTYNLGNAMGTTVLAYQDMSDHMEAIMSMDGVSRGQGDRPEFGIHYLPIPIIHADYEINARVLAASRSMGNPLDTISAEAATRRVAEKLEKMLFTDTSYKFGGGSIYSYVNHPDRNLVVLSKNWTDSSVSGKDILLDVKALKDAAMADLMYGPYQVYIPTAFETRLDEDYSDAKGDNTIRDRIMKIANIKGIKVVPTLAPNTVLLVQMTSNVVRLVRGMGIQNVQWDTEGKFVTKYKVFTIQVPQIRSDYEGRSGIVHATFTS